MYTLFKCPDQTALVKMGPVNGRVRLEKPANREKWKKRRENSSRRKNFRREREGEGERRAGEREGVFLATGAISVARRPRRERKTARERGRERWERGRGDVAREEWRGREEREIENENSERETSSKFMSLNALKILLIYEKSRTFF